MGRPRSEYYVSGAELKFEIQKYQDSSPIKEERMASEELAGMIMKIATKYAKRPNLIGYSYTDEFVSLSVMRVLHNLDKIDLQHPRCNIFAYFSRVCERSCQHIINTETIQSKIKSDLLAVFMEEFEQEGMAFDIEVVDDNFLDSGESEYTREV